MLTHKVEWRTPEPLWSAVRDLGAEYAKRPEILRFDGDDFMDQYHRTLDDEERDLERFYAAAETWRTPSAQATGLDAPTAEERLKLYQPAHGRYYLAAGALVCRKYGLPPKQVDTKAKEDAYYVIRRLEPKSPTAKIEVDTPSTFDEYGWMLGADGPKWGPAGDREVKQAEERLPLFPYTYAAGSTSRTMLTGLIPASAREKYETAATEPTLPGSDPMADLADDRLARLDQIVAGLQALVTSPAFTPRIEVKEEDGDGDGDGVPVEVIEPKLSKPDHDVNEALYFTLVDLDDFLDHVGGDRAAVEGVLGEAGRTFDSKTWLDAVEEARAGRPAIEAETSTAPGAPVEDMTLQDVLDAVDGLGVTSGKDALETGLFEDVKAVLTPLDDATAEPSTEETALSDDDVAEPVYIVRFGYERPQCVPSHRLVLSPPSRPFVLSSFFDADAPVRPVHIDLSIDTSPAGLRKFAKGGVSVTLSKQLREQIERIQMIKMKALDDGDIPDGNSYDLGMICTLSIPIITICALILLMIIVSLLNIVFFWLPLFKVCRPKA